MTHGNAINAYVLRTERGGTVRTYRFEPGNAKEQERARQRAIEARDGWPMRSDIFAGTHLYVEPATV